MPHKNDRRMPLSFFGAIDKLEQLTRAFFCTQGIVLGLTRTGPETFRRAAQVSVRVSVDHRFRRQSRAKFADGTTRQSS